MTHFLTIIDKTNDYLGKFVSFFIFPVIGIVIFEVIMRYFLHRSQLWVPEISLFLFGSLFVLGGGYAYLHNYHVKLDAVYDQFPVKVKAVLDLFTFFFFCLFCVVLTWKGWITAWDSLITMEKSSSAFAPVLFPIRMTIPIGSALLLLQGIAQFIRNIFILIKGS